MTESAPRAVLWDLDGTLVDSSEQHFVAWRDTLASLGRGYTRADHDLVFGLRNDAVLRRLVDPAIDPAEIARVAGAKERRYRDLVAAAGIEPLPGVRRWLAALQARGFRMAVASSAPPANLEAVMAAATLNGAFDALVSGEEVPHGKPDPAVFLAAAERLSVPPARCVVVEDAPAGIEAGRRGGMRVIGVGPRHAELDADLTVERLDQLPEDAFDLLVPA
jgi:beta-phosphoglucomutase